MIVSNKENVNTSSWIKRKYFHQVFKEYGTEYCGKIAFVGIVLIVDICKVVAKYCTAQSTGQTNGRVGGAKEDNKRSAGSPPTDWKLQRKKIWCALVSQRLVLFLHCLPLPPVRLVNCAV